jgi:hypothetical protein
VNDLALGLIALIVAAVPVSLGVLLLADGFGLDGEGRTRRWIRLALVVLAVPALAWTGVAAWGWAGAAHLEPLCQAFATPEYRATTPVQPGDILLDVVPTASPPPPWSRAFGGELITDPASSAAAAAPLELEVRRLTHHQNFWFKVEMDRFRLLQRQWLPSPPDVHLSAESHGAACGVSQTSRVE